MPDPIVDALKAARKSRGLSLQRLGELLGRTTYQTPWQWESGSNDPSLSNVRQWAAVLGYDVALVPLSATEPPQPGPAVGTDTTDAHRPAQAAGTEETR